MTCPAQLLRALAEQVQVRRYKCLQLVLIWVRAWRDPSQITSTEEGG